MHPNLIRAMKAAAVTVAATVAGWQLFDVLYAWAQRAADAQVAVGEDWFAGSTQYILANAAGSLFLPFAVWVGLRLVAVRGNHLAVIISGFIWLTLVVPNLVDARPGAGTVILWVAVEAAATAAAAVLQTASPRR